MVFMGVNGFLPVPPQVSERLSQPGVAIGLAWTPLGGEIMFVEASRMDGDGQLTLTGQLGDVMKESAHLAISWLRSNAKRYQLTNGGWAQGLHGHCSLLGLHCSLTPTLTHREPVTHKGFQPAVLP